MRILFVAAVATFLPYASAAQAPSTGGSGGMWWEASISAAGARLTCPLCDPDRELGPTVTAAIGAYATQGLRVGLEGSAWTNEDEGVRESIYGAAVVAQLHPRPGSGLHLLGGVGWSGYRAEEFTYDAPRLTLGVGWDLPLIASWVAGNRLTLDAASYASLKNEGARVERSVGLSVVRLGVYLRRR